MRSHKPCCCAARRPPAPWQLEATSRRERTDVRSSRLKFRFSHPRGKAKTCVSMQGLLGWLGITMWRFEQCNQFHWFTSVALHGMLAQVYVRAYSLINGRTQRGRLLARIPSCVWERAEAQRRLKEGKFTRSHGKEAEVTKHTATSIWGLSLAEAPIQVPKKV